MDDKILKPGSKEYIKCKINDTINELVYDKLTMRKCYNYYNGKLDRDQFKHIEENYGIGMPTSITFIPLLKKHVDVLVGEFCDMPLNIRISCKDKDTISEVFKEKQEKILNELKYKIIGSISDYISIIFGDQSSESSFKPIDINKLKEELEDNFISSYEIAAQNIIQYLSQSDYIDSRTKLVKLLTDLLISGTMYYRVTPTEDNENINLEALNPMNTFVERNNNSMYLKDSPRAVCKYFMQHHQVINKYSKYLSDDDKNKLRSNKITNTVDSFEVIRADNPIIGGVYHDSTGILGGLEVTPTVLDNETYNSSKYLPVFEVEYIETDNDGVEHLYSGVKISQDIYIIHEKDKNVVRSKNSKSKCRLTINGIFMTDRNDKPFSLIESTMDLQDQYNLLFYYKNAAIATSGVNGDWIDFSMIPTWLGDNDTERLLKFLAYKKQGIALFTTEEREEGSAPLNTTFGGYDNTVSYNAIQAIELAINSVENTVSSITGVTREKLGMIEQRDAVSNVKVGIQQSTVITKRIFYAMNLISKEMMLDMLNLAKVVYKNGLTGMIILGDARKEIFTADAKHFTLTDFDIHIMDGGEAVKDMELIQQLVFELIKGQQVDAEVAIEAIGCKSLTELKGNTLKSVKAKSEQMNQASQMQQQLQQMEQQMKELQQMNEQLKAENNKLQNKVGTIDSSQPNGLEAWEVKKKADQKDRELDLKQKQLDLEIMHMNDNNPYNNEIKNI